MFLVLARGRGRLEEFAVETFEAMGRKDQRRWGEVYLRGLMLDAKRKSIEPMAARLEDGTEVFENVESNNTNERTELAATVAA